MSKVLYLTEQEDDSVDYVIKSILSIKFNNLFLIFNQKDSIILI